MYAMQHKHAQLFYMVQGAQEQCYLVIRVQDSICDHRMDLRTWRVAENRCRSQAARKLLHLLLDGLISAVCAKHGHASETGRSVLFRHQTAIVCSASKPNITSCLCAGTDVRSILSSTQIFCLRLDISHGAGSAPLRSLRAPQPHSDGV